MKRDDEEEKQKMSEEIHKQLDFVDSQHLHDPNLVTPPNRVWSGVADCDSSRLR